MFALGGDFYEFESVVNASEVLKSNQENAPFEFHGCANTTAAGSEDPEPRDSKDAKDAKPSFNCTNCIKVFECPRLQQRHEKYCKLERKFECDHCGHKAKFKNELATHIESVHQPVQATHACSNCNKCFKMPFLRRKHERYCGKEPDIPCGQCSYVTCLKHDLAKHVERMHRRGKPSHNCSVCNRAFKLELSKSIHEEYCRGILCSHCDFKTPDSQAFVRHVRLEHPNSECDFKCSHCCKQFILFESLLRHERYCRARKKYACDECNYVTKFSSDLAKHVARVHGREWTRAESLEVCAFCRKAFKSESSRYRHEEYCCFICCDYCKYRTSVERDFVKHVELEHPDSKSNFRCSNCRKVFFFRALLLRHEKYCRSGEKVACGECDYNTELSGSLVAHMKSAHRKVAPRPHVCSDCGNKFKLARLLRKHRKYCGKEPNITCAICGYRTFHRSKYVGHFKSKHGKLLDNCSTEPQRPQQRKSGRIRQRLNTSRRSAATRSQSVAPVGSI